MKIGDLVRVRANRIPPKCTRVGLVVKMRMKAPKNQNTTFIAYVKWTNGNVSHLPQWSLDVL